MTNYNGWKNWETWNCSLWIDNEEGSYRHWQGETQDAWDEAEGSSDRKDDATSDLTKRLESWLEEQTPSLEGMFGDFITQAVNQIDCREIAEHMLADFEEEEEEEEEETQAANE